MMLTIKNWQTLSAVEKKCCLARPTQSLMMQTQVAAIIQQVQNEGDKALFALTQKLDKARLTSLQVAPEKIRNATVSATAFAALNAAIKNITAYHQSLLPENKLISTAPGVTLETVYRPIQRVGLYVPGGNNTPLVSSLLMQTIPALVAGCPIKVLCTPANAQGEINEHVLVAARLCGIDTIYALGGAQAIAAMAYGTDSITKVDKIFGPGNSYVTEAKKLVAQDPHGAAIDMPAGPSEVMITADAQANPAFIAADLLAQAEHGADSHVVFISEEPLLAERVNRELSQQLTKLPRQELIKQALAKSVIILCDDLNEQQNIINAYAPEHLIINRADAQTWVPYINAAGTIFLGSWAAETLGDYLSGSNHVLPTYGFAKNHSGLSTLDFLTRFTVQSIDAEGIKNIGPAAITLAQIEGLNAHANAVAIRLNSLEV